MRTLIKGGIVFFWIVLYLNYGKRRGKGVAVMKGMMPPIKMPRSIMMPMMEKHEMMIRRAPNHNVHVITHHGKLMVGRKGRKG